MASALVLALAACSGSTAPEASEPTPAATTAVATVATTSSVTTTVPPATTTTAPPLAAVPLGVRWAAGPSLASSSLSDTRRHRIVTVGEATWYLSTTFNGAAIHRSLDGGVTWASSDVGPPTPGETLRIDDLAEGSNGRLVAIATRGIRCRSAVDAGDGYQNVSLCARQAAAILLSDDDGATWRRVDPASMAPPGDASVRPAGIVATATGFVAAATVAGPDWHARLWSSPDGENWTLAREVRGASPSASADQLLTDGSALVLVLSEHPCATPRTGAGPGWDLGVDWVEWPRVFSGTTVADLAPLAPADHPFVRDLDISTCDVLGTLPGISAVDDSHPGMTGLVVGGTVTLLEDPRPTPADLAAEKADDDEAEVTSGRRRLSQLVDGRWTLVEIDGVQSSLRSSRGPRSQLIDVDGTPGIFETAGSRDAETTPAPILPVGDGTWVQRVPEHGILAQEIAAAAWVDDALVAVAATTADPWADTMLANEPVTLAVWTSRETGGPRPPCELGPGVVCLFADLTRSPGYPDVAGIDLAGADLAYAQFGAADFSGATFDGARLWGVRSGPDSSTDGATFTGARAQGAQLRSSVGADFTAADISSSSLFDATGAVFTGASLRRATITMDLGSLANLAGVALIQARITLTPPATGPFEVSLAGFDLTKARVGAPFDGPLLKVVDLDGAVLTDAALSRVDLTAIDPTVVDLSTVDVWDKASVCPDGQPPDGLPIGTCTRAPTGP